MLFVFIGSSTKFVLQTHGGNVFKLDIRTPRMIKIEEFMICFFILNYTLAQRVQYLSLKDHQERNFYRSYWLTRNSPEPQ